MDELEIGTRHLAALLDAMVTTDCEHAIVHLDDVNLVDSGLLRVLRAARTRLEGQLTVTADRTAARFPLALVGLGEGVWPARHDLALVGVMSAAEHIGRCGPLPDPPHPFPQDEQRTVPALRAVDIAPTTAVWTGDYAMAVELARVLGPARGIIEAPAPLLDHAPTDASGDLDQTDTKIRLYEFCLIHGSCFEIYRCVNLAELVRLWPRLSLPTGIRAQWAGALRDIGLIPARSRPVPRLTRCLPSVVTPTSRKSANDDEPVRA